MIHYYYYNNNKKTTCSSSSSSKPIIIDNNNNNIWSFTLSQAKFSWSQAIIIIKVVTTILLYIY